MVDSCQDDGVCKPEIFVHVEMDGGIIGNDFLYKTNSTFQYTFEGKPFFVVVGQPVM